MRWLFSILVCAAFAAGAILLFQSLADYNVAKNQIATLQTERQDYENLKRTYEEEEQKVAIVNALWDDLQRVNLKPSDWTRFPLSVNKLLDWKDVEKLLVLSSNRLKEEPGYYFKPEMIRLSRVVVEQTGAAQAQGGEPAAESAVPVAAEALGLPPLQKYDTTIRGAFLIPKAE